jgi:hypothetical protein
MFFVSSALLKCRCVTTDGANAGRGICEGSLTEAPPIHGLCCVRETVWSPDTGGASTFGLCINYRFGGI